MKELKLKLSSNVMNQTADFLRHRETLKYEISNYGEVKNIPKIDIAEKITIELAKQKILNVSENSVIAYYVVSTKKKDTDNLTQWYIFEEFIKTENIKKTENRVINSAPMDITVEIEN